jgi:hypothetical protein
MRSTYLAALSALSLLVPAFASANDAEVQQQLRDMQQRMQQMEDKLQAASDQLESANQRVEEQSQLIEQSGLAETRGSSSGLPGFLGELTIGGSVAASYLYNVNDPNDSDRCDGLGPNGECFLVEDDGNLLLEGEGGLGGTNSGVNGRFYPLHPDHNSFALDAVWFEVERPVDEEHRGGFRFDTVYGKTGALLNGDGVLTGGPSNRRDGLRDDTALYVFQGYVQYLAPIGSGILFKAGKFGDLFGIGTESSNNIYSWNITRGNVWSLLEPIDHIGVLATAGIGDTGLNISLGGVNGFLPDDPDRNDAKSVLGRIGWDSETVHASVAGIWGGEQQGNDGNETGVVNGTLRIDASDRLGFYLNGDYAWRQESDDAAWGVAAAGRFGITERTGIALRGEYVADVDGYLGFFGETFGGVDIDNEGFNVWAPTGIEVWGITATVDHLLTDHLMIRAEARYDNIDKDDTDNDEFFQDSNDLDNDQIVVGAEVIYNFNKFGGE